MQHLKKYVKHFYRRKLIYSISTLVCSNCAGVFNVNPQSGIEVPRGRGGTSGVGRGFGGVGGEGCAAPHCATKKQSNKWTYGDPAAVHNGRHAEYIRENISSGAEQRDVYATQQIRSLKQKGLSIFPHPPSLLV